MTIDPALLRRRLLLTAILVIPVIVAAWQVDLPRKWRGFRGDSAVYYAMADSLAHDFDLLYTRGDLERISRRWPDGPQGVLLTADDANPRIIHYAKPLLYPLAAAPLVRVFAENGMLILNAVCFGILLFCGFMAFPGSGKRETAVILWTITFWGLTVVPAYIFTLTPDLFNGTLVMIVMTLWVRWEHRDGGDGSVMALLAAAAILGFAAATRPPSGLFIVPLLWSLLMRRSPEMDTKNTFSLALRRRVLPAAGVILLFAGAAALVFLLTHAMTGQVLAHGGFRKRIVGRFPFQNAGLTFLNTGNMISTRNTKFVFHFHTLLLNIKYFFFGRFTGLFPYFLPAATAMIAGLPFLRDRRDGNTRRRLIPVWIVCIGMILFHLVYIPTNYHGGSCAVGNRYLISYLPIFFFLMIRPPRMRTILTVAAFTAILTGAVAVDPIDAMARYQDVSKARRYDRFPLETTLLNSWPVDDTRHMKVAFPDQRRISGDDDVFHIYFADDNQFGRELGGFWVWGDSHAAMVMRCYFQPVQRLRFVIRNGGAANRISLRAGQSFATRKVSPGEEITVEMDPGESPVFYNLNGDPAMCIPVSISTTNGFIPRFTEPGSRDSRFLGCFVKIEIIS